jgi:hypothetical protein
MTRVMTDAADAGGATATVVAVGVLVALAVGGAVLAAPVVAVVVDSAVVPLAAVDAAVDSTPWTATRTCPGGSWPKAARAGC